MTRRQFSKSRRPATAASTPNWQAPALLALASWLLGTKFIPGLFAQNPFLKILTSLIVPAAWLLTVLFAVAAVVAFIQSRAARDSTMPLWQPVEPSAPAPQAPAATRDAVREIFGSENEWARWGRSGTSPQPTRPDAWSLAVLDQVEWKRFEDLCCEFYREKGIRAATTRLGADGGIDIRLYQDPAQPSLVTSIVQCKAWNQLVGVKPVRELRGVMAHEKVEKAFFMAPNGFTEEAKVFAAGNRIILLDGKLILAMFQRLPPEAAQRLLEFATRGDWTTPTCPGCGAKMTARQGKRGRFWGCRFYPKCRGLLQMRGGGAA